MSDENIPILDIKDFALSQIYLSSIYFCLPISFSYYFTTFCVLKLKVKND
jgi:hypothetical protein